MVTKLIKNANVVLENGIIWDGGILIDDDKIIKADRLGNIEVPEGAEVIDAKGAYVGPGFVDIHVHGGAGCNLFVEPQMVAEHFLKHGETSILPTSPGMYSFEELIEGIRKVKDAMKTSKSIKGVYMEGPYINSNYGACKGLVRWSSEIKEEHYIPLVDELGSIVKVYTIAPEREDIMKFLEYARKVNPDVVFSVGHSDAKPEQIRALGVKYCPKLTTHLMNATGRQTGADSGGIKGYGPDEYCMANKDMYAELISDSNGIHVHSDLQRMIIKNKGIERVVLVTDSTSYKGKNPDKYAHVDDLSFNDLGRLAGSKLTMDKACRNIMAHTNCGIAQAFVMASLNPAKVIGMDEQIGSIEPGKIADLVFVDDKFNVQQVMLNGEMVNLN